MSLSTKDVKIGGGGLPKTIGPGEHVLKINSMELQQFPFMEADNAYYLVLNVETEPIEGFQGFMLDKDNESLGRYAGQIGQIKTNRFYYVDGKTKSGIVIERDMEIMKQIKSLCVASDMLKWFDDADGKHATIEEMVEAFNKSDVYRDKLFKFCVAGKDFERKNGYTGHDLFFPKLTRGKVAYELADTKVSKILEFDEEKHWTKMVSEDVEGFGEDSSDIPTGTGTDLTNAPSFNL